MIISTHIIPLFPYLRYNKVVIDVNLDVKIKKCALHTSTPRSPQS